MYGDDWSEDCGSFSKSGTDLFIGCPKSKSKVWITLDLSAGYLGLRSIESELDTIINTAKCLVEKFYISKLPTREISNHKNGELIYPKPLLVFDGEVRELSDEEKIAIPPLL